MFRHDFGVSSVIESEPQDKPLKATLTGALALRIQGPVRRSLVKPLVRGAVVGQGRDLYAAMGSNAVLASTRAAVRWCYALLEHESIKPRRTPLRVVRARWLRHLVSREALESLGRWLHRCVGYGQRPSRALASWLVATAAVTVWSVQCRAVEGGAAGWLERIAEVLVSPLGVLRLGSGGEAGGLVGDPAFDPVAYLVVGLPFIFFVLSMREFFRSPLNPRSSMP